MNIENRSGWKPEGKAILLKAVELEELQSGSIFIPDDVRQASAGLDTVGVVVAIGADAWSGPGETPRAKVGDRVLFTKYAGGTIKGKDGAVYRFISDHSIYATEEK